MRTPLHIRTVVGQGVTQQATSDHQERERTNMRIVSKMMLLFAVLFVTTGLGAVASAKDKGAGPWTPDSTVGQNHIQMARSPDFGYPCQACHNVDTGMAPPSLAGVEGVNMKEGRACAKCHGGEIFITFMRNGGTAPSRCSDCHPVGSEKSK
jgi:hypothetical protein